MALNVEQIVTDATAGAVTTRNVSVAVGAGEAVVVFVSARQAVTVTDDGGNTYVQQDTPSQTVNNYPFVCLDAVAATTLTITPAASTQIATRVYRVSGHDTSAVDAHAYDEGGSAVPPSWSITTVAADTLVIGSVSKVAAGTSVVTAGDGFTDDGTAATTGSAGVSNAGAHQILTAQATKTLNWTFDIGRQWSGSLVSLAAASGAPSPQTLSVGAVADSSSVAGGTVAASGSVPLSVAGVADPSSVAGGTLSPSGSAALSVAAVDDSSSVSGGTLSLGTPAPQLLRVANAQAQSAISQLTIPVSPATTDGSTLVVLTAIKQTVGGGQTVANVTDDAGNIYHPSPAGSRTNSSLNGDAWYAKDAAPATEIYVKVNGIPADGVMAELHEWSHGAPRAVYHASATGFGGSTSTGPVVPSLTTTFPRVGISGVGIYNTTADATIDATDGFTKQSHVTTGAGVSFSMVTATREVAATGTYGCDFTYASGTRAYVGVALAIVGPTSGQLYIAPAPIADGSQVAGGTLGGAVGTLSPAGVVSGSAAGGSLTGSGSVPLAPAAVVASPVVGAAALVPDTGRLTVAAVVNSPVVGAATLVISGAASLRPAGVVSGSAAGGTLTGSGAATLAPAGVVAGSLAGGGRLLAPHGLQVAGVPSSSVVGAGTLTRVNPPTIRRIVHLYSQYQEIQV